MRRLLLIGISSVALSGCLAPTSRLPSTLGELNNGYSYVALDPLPVRATLERCQSRRGDGQKADWMDAVPDSAVRIAIDQLSGSANGTLGPVTLGTKGSSYRVVLDYVNVDTTNIRFALWDQDASNPFDKVARNELGGIHIQRLQPDTKVGDGQQEVVIPVYVGAGLRLTALVTVKKGEINLASLGAIAAAAEAEDISGTLTVQTLGISGQQVAASLPLPSELNSTTIQNAIQSLGAIKATLYDRDTSVTPRITGIYNPLPSSDRRLISAIVSQLAFSPVEWRPCAVTPPATPVAAPAPVPIPADQQIGR